MARKPISIETLLPFSNKELYKQKSGNINKSGQRKGITNRLNPHVKTLMNIHPKIVKRIVNEMMKQPP
jgi:hypothetical protein